jgi:ParB family chromosome partitioning protein
MTTKQKKSIFSQASGTLAGSGIDALFNKSNPDYALVPIYTIAVKEQVRKTFEDAENPLDDLAASIKAQGVLQPILLRPLGEGYELVAGERRLRAANRVGLEEIPAYIREMSDEEARDAQLAENIHRMNLSMMEEAARIQRDLDDLGSVEAVLAKYHKSHGWISKKLQLLKLPQQANRIVMEHISADQELILEVARLEKRNPEAAAELVDQLKKNRGSSNARDQVKAVKEQTKPKKPFGHPEPNSGTEIFAPAKKQRGIEEILDDGYKNLQAGQTVNKAFAFDEVPEGTIDKVHAYLKAAYDNGLSEGNTTDALIVGLRSNRYTTEGKGAFLLAAFVQGAARKTFDPNSIFNGFRLGRNTRG